MAAKKTSELLPYCHPVPIDGVQLSFALLPDAIRVQARVYSVSKTGVEMEALTAVSVATLTLYDMLKPIDKGLEITHTKLLEKHGGKSDFQEHIPQNFKAAVVVTSDGTHRGTREDKPGKIIQERLAAHDITDITYIILPDDQTKIRDTLSELCDGGTHLIITTGGTGLGPRDVTVEATAEVIEREVVGIAEAMRMHGQRRTPYAMLSRGLVGLRGQTLIVNLPGSSRGAMESMDAIFPAVLHSFKMLHGDAR
jgi:molybdenum cofactor synthesis domain-containing protein